jgi:hypothetical protein
MTHWNVAYNTNFLWNGDLNTLEQVAAGTIISSDEFDSTPEEVEAELKAVPEYVRMFDSAFGDGADSITYTNIARAIASFQRTLVSANSPYDRFARGDFEALTPRQRRGLVIFRSSRTRCNDCHSAPKFADDRFSVTGVPPLPGTEVDPGRAAVDPQGAYRAFKAPTLRNIALTAPYMHNGVFTTLEQVIDFYAKGGGRQDGVQGMDVHVQGFQLSDSERADLVSFLYALTDESGFQGIPASVPSGLPVVPRLENPAREIIQRVNRPVKEDQAEGSREPQVFLVEAGQSIQSVIDRARTGDTVQIAYGIFSESFLVDEPGIHIVGLRDARGEYPVLDGMGQGPNGILVSGDGFELSGLVFRGYADSAVRIKNARDVHLHDLVITGPGNFGIALESSSNVQVEHVRVSGMRSAGLYAGSSEGVSFVDVASSGNAIGIDMENSVQGVIEASHVYENSVGIFVTVLPHLPSKVSLKNHITDSIVENNNAGSVNDSNLPAGTGIRILRGHKHAGLEVASLTGDLIQPAMDVGIYPEFFRAEGNSYAANRADILWDGMGKGNAFDDRGATSVPTLLPTGTWIEPMYRLYWRYLMVFGENISR